MNNLSHTIAILAYNHHDMTLKNIQHLIALGYGENIFLFDNGSNPSYENNAYELQIRYHREQKNIFINPAWNIIINQENCDYLTLLNNDCFILSPKCKWPPGKSYTTSSVTFRSNTFLSGSFATQSLDLRLVLYF